MKPVLILIAIVAGAGLVYWLVWGYAMGKGQNDQARSMIGLAFALPFLLVYGAVSQFMDFVKTLLGIKKA